MRGSFATAVVGVAVMLAPLAAQDKAPKPPKPEPEPKVLSLSGCVVRGESGPNQYTIEDSKEGTYRLTGTDLRDFIGKRVETAGGRAQFEAAENCGRADAKRERRRPGGRHGSGARSCRLSRRFRGAGQRDAARIQGEKRPSGQRRMLRLTGLTGKWRLFGRDGRFSAVVAAQIQDGQCLRASNYLRAWNAAAGADNTRGGTFSHRFTPYSPV